MNYEHLIEILDNHKIYLQTHNYPDPDALASAFGMQVFLRAYGIDTVICYAGNIEKNSTKRMIEEFGIEAVHIDKLQDMSETDYIVTIDAQKYNSNITDFPGDEIACIDHHPTIIPCAYEYSDIRICGACSSIVASYFKESNTSIDKKTATALLYGIKMDTDSFNRGVTNFDIEMFGYLHEFADNNKITALYHSNMEIEDLHAYGEAIRNIKIFDNVGFASINFDCPDALVAMISDFILGLDVVELSVVYATRNGGYKFSVRNETDIFHAGTITQKALEGLGGGGGHYSMAGGFMTKEALESLGPNKGYMIRQRFMDVINQELEQYKKQKENEQ